MGCGGRLRFGELGVIYNIQASVGHASNRHCVLTAIDVHHEVLVRTLHHEIWSIIGWLLQGFTHHIILNKHMGGS